ncbi:MAG: GntR family transcriptional regulator [Desulfotomaculaceae bacterium]|nr:GntR family transcriptional regulator [Desulfotomaculaceae bacterium]
MLLGLDMVEDKPIYVQIAEWLENEILCGNIRENEKIYSQYQLAEMFNINPATAAKGINILADQGILYKKRGLGMFLSANSKEKIQYSRKNHTLKKLVEAVVTEARRLGVYENELIDMMRDAKKELDEHEK